MKRTCCNCGQKTQWRKRFKVTILEAAGNLVDDELNDDGLDYDEEVEYFRGPLCMPCVDTLIDHFEGGRKQKT
jgi:hypothetical protein